jgi:hypothetical protein
MNNKYGRITFPNPADSGGFFSNYFSVLSTMGSCIGRQLIPYVDSTNTWFNPTCDFENNLVSDPSINPWDWWFVQEKSPDNAYTDVGLFRGAISHVPKQFITNPNMPAFRKVAKDFCKIQPHILKEEEWLYKKHIEGKKTLGILARGTEMLVHHMEYPKSPAEAWPGIIAYCLSKNPEIDNIFLVSDDKRIIESILNAYPKTKYLKNFFRSTNQTEEELADKIKPWWLSAPGDLLSHRKRVGEEALIQTRLLSRCQYFIGSHSGMSNAVNFFRETPFKSNNLI